MTFPKLFRLFFAILLTACTSAVPNAQTWGVKGSLPGQFNEPFDVAVDQQGFVYVTDVRNRRVQEFDAHGKFLRAFGRNLFEKPGGIGIGPNGNIWVTDFDLDRVFRFNSKGKLLASWGKAGDGSGAFNVPADVAVDSKGFVYIVGEYHHRIQKFTSDGHFLRTWGKKGKINVVLSAMNFLLPEMRRSEFYYPSRIAIAPDDRIYVSDAYNNRVQVFDTDGRWLQSIGGLACGVDVSALRRALASLATDHCSSATSTTTAFNILIKTATFLMHGEKVENVRGSSPALPAWPWVRTGRFM